MFIEFKTRKRLCVHATGKWEEAEGCLALEVTQSVFHCGKYIDPSYEIARFASRRPRKFKTAEFAIVGYHGRLIQQLVDFLAGQRVAFVCTVDRNGQCSVNHRGGKCGFISVNGVHGKARVLLPGYAGNGAFEAVGNIWETRRAAVFVADPERGYGVCVSGPAELFYGEVLQTEPFVGFSGAQRVLAIDPLDCQLQSWNDDLGSEEDAQEPPLDPNGAEDVLTGSYRTRGPPE
jgi:Pyridoxamine 5'-phosphate oxidase